MTEPGMVAFVIGQAGTRIVWFTSTYAIAEKTLVKMPLQESQSIRWAVGSLPAHEIRLLFRPEATP
jgi:hypothetical protein